PRGWSCADRRGPWHRSRWWFGGRGDGPSAGNGRTDPNGDDHRGGPHRRCHVLRLDCVLARPGGLMSAVRRLMTRSFAALYLGAVALCSAPVLAAEAEGDAHAASNPLGWQADLSLWSLIVFLLSLAVLTKLAWKPLTSGLDARERRIRDDIAAAETARIKAEQLLAEHSAKLDRVQDEVKAILAEARRDAEVARQNIISSAQSEAEA